MLHVLKFVQDDMNLNLSAMEFICMIQIKNLLKINMEPITMLFGLNQQIKRMTLKIIK